MSSAYTHMVHNQDKKTVLNGVEPDRLDPTGHSVVHWI